jgi:predicted RNA-binding Zn-ribbon protein involved in translation (DUF1610 family)
VANTRSGRLRFRKGTSKLSGISVILGIGFTVVSLIAIGKIITKAGYSGWWVIVPLLPLMGYIITALVAASDVSSGYSGNNVAGWLVFDGILGFLAWVFFLVFAFSAWPSAGQPRVQGYNQPAYGQHRPAAVAPTPKTLVALVCPLCKAEGRAPDYAVRWTCPQCSNVFVFRRCAHCRRVSFIRAFLASASQLCVWCGQAIQNAQQGSGVALSANSIAEEIVSQGTPWYQEPARCASCSAPVDISRKFCVSCGAPVVSQNRGVTVTAPSGEVPGTVPAGHETHSVTASSLPASPVVASQVGCPSCQAAQPADSAFCGRCGTPIIRRDANVPYGD